MSKIFVLDACALIALLNNENGADKVVSAYRAAENDEAQIIMNRINCLKFIMVFIMTREKITLQKF